MGNETGESSIKFCIFSVVFLFFPSLLSFSFLPFFFNPDDLKAFYPRREIRTQICETPSIYTGVGIEGDA